MVNLNRFAKQREANDRKDFNDEIITFERWKNKWQVN